MAATTKAVPKDKDDDDRTTTRKRTTDVRAGEKITEPELTSATTTAPAPPADADSEQDMSAFFSSGHGAAQHYDQVYQGAQSEVAAV